MHIISNMLFLTRTTSSHLGVLLPFSNVIQLTLLTMTPHCMTFLASHLCNITRICMYIYSFNSFVISDTFHTFLVFRALYLCCCWVWQSIWLANFIIMYPFLLQFLLAVGIVPSSSCWLGLHVYVNIWNMLQGIASLCICHLEIIGWKNCLLVYKELYHYVRTWLCIIGHLRTNK